MFIEKMFAMNDIHTSTDLVPVPAAPLDVRQGEGVDDDEEEEEEMPEDLKDLPWETQQLRLLLRSMYMMCMGTLLVLIFSDPMVEVLSEMGERTGIPAFVSPPTGHMHACMHACILTVIHT
jgi:hypothetical protein